MNHPMESRLMIGGPYDGQWMAISTHDETLVIPRYSKDIASVISSTSGAMTEDPYAVESYRRLRISIDQIGVEVLAHADLSSAQILYALISDYRR